MSPRIGRSRAFNRPWSHSTALLAYRSVQCHAAGSNYQSQIYFTGWLTPDQVAAWYRRADVLVVPSRYEPFGMVILEGMLHGLPVLASAVGGPAEILHDEHTGLLFPPMDVPALSRQLIRLVHNADLRQQLGTAAAAELRSRWLWPQTVQAMRHVYDEVIPAAPAPVLRAS